MKKIVLFLTTFVICAVIITATMIKINQYKQNNSVNENETINVVKDSDANEINTKGIDIFGTYNENSLLINDVKEKDGNIEIVIPKIEGLKDKTVEKKINDDIYSRVNNFIELNKTNKIEKYGFDVRGNFANVLSIDYYSFNKGNRVEIGLNYNLINGERLKYEDLFVSDADMIDVTRNIIYKSMIDYSRNDYENNKYLFEYSYDFEYNSATEEELETLTKNDELYYLQFDESSIMNKLNRLIKEGKVDFSFTPMQVSFFDGKRDNRRNHHSFGMNDFPSSIGIYNKFLTSESIFEDDSIGKKDLWTMSKYNPFDFEDFKKEHNRLEEFSCGLLEDNLWYDNVIYTDYDYIDSIEIVKANYKKLIQLEKEYQDNVLKEYQEKASKNKNKFYVLLNYTSLGKDGVYIRDSEKNSYSDINIVQRKFYIYEFPKDMYEKNYKNQVYDLHREYFYFPLPRAHREFIPIEINEKDNIVFEEKNESYLIKLENNKIISRIEDLIADYTKVYDLIRKEISEDRWLNYDSNQIEDYIKHAKFEFEIENDYPEYYLRVSSDGYEDIIIESDDLKEFLLIMEEEKK